MKFKEGIQITTNRFLHDLITTRHIHPEEILEKESEIRRVKNAINTIRVFRLELTRKGLNKR